MDLEGTQLFNVCLLLLWVHEQSTVVHSGLWGLFQRLIVASFNLSASRPVVVNYMSGCFDCKSLKSSAASLTAAAAAAAISSYFWHSSSPTQSSWWISGRKNRLLMDVQHWSTQKQLAVCTSDTVKSFLWEIVMIQEPLYQFKLTKMHPEQTLMRSLRTQWPAWIDSNPF